MHKKDNYYKGGHHKYRLTIHLVLVSKFRCKIFDKHHGLIIKGIIQDMQNCPDLKDIYYGEKRLLWSRGYFMCSVGDASNDTIKRYIEAQG